MLWEEYRQSDAAAKAAARFESDIHQKLVDQRKAEGFEDDEAGNIRRVFSSTEFNSSFRKFLIIRLEARLVELLGLDEFKDEILRCRIPQVFGADAPKNKQPIVKDDHIHYGTPEQQLLLGIQSAARSRRRR